MQVSIYKRKIESRYACRLMVCDPVLPGFKNSAIVVVKFSLKDPFSLLVRNSLGTCM